MKTYELTTQPVEQGAGPIRAVRRRVLSVVSVLALTIGISIGLAQPASAAYNPGQVCNNSSRSIWVTVQPFGQNWMASQVSPGTCTPWPGHDAEAVWGQRCDAAGRCQYVSWKVNGYTTTTVRDGYISPIPPGRALFVSGSGSWQTASEWPRPNLNQIGYDLR
jgi:hypothetical protein